MEHAGPIIEPLKLLCNNQHEVQATSRNVQVTPQGATLSLR